MSVDQHTYELIDQYLKGELVGQDLDRFKIRLKDDAEFLAQVQLQKAIIEAIEDRRAAEIKSVLQKARTKTKPYVIPIRTRYLAVAASLLSLLAFGLIIKTLLPQQQPEFVEETDIIQPEDTSSNTLAQLDVNDSNLNTDQDAISLNGPSSPEVVTNEIDADTAGLIAMVEDVQEDDMTQATLSETDANEVVRIDELKKAEDRLTLKSGVVTQQDSMIGVGYIVAYAISVRETVEQEDETTAKQIQTKEKAASADGVTATKSKISDVKVEYWHSVLGSTKVKYDGNKLVVFEEPNVSNYTLIRYMGATYLKKNQNYYHLPISSSFVALRLVTDSAVLKALKQ